MTPRWLVLEVVLLAGCTWEVCLGDCDLAQDTGLEADLLSYTVSWGSESLFIDITSGAEGGYDFGMAETGAGDLGWYGEDCYAGTANYNYCHQLPSAGGALDYVADYYDVVESESTLFYSPVFAWDVTFYFDDGVDCWTFGEDPSYYVDAYGCEWIDGVIVTDET